MNIEETIKDRQSKYGSFKDFSKTYRDLQEIMYRADDLTHSQSAALDMMCVKLSRIATGNPNLVDNWHDIAGYATLVERELIKANSVKPEDFCAAAD
jgi:hypothetical protein